MNKIDALSVAAVAFAAFAAYAYLKPKAPTAQSGTDAAYAAAAAQRREVGSALYQNNLYADSMLKNAGFLPSMTNVSLGGPLTFTAAYETPSLWNI